MIPYQKISTEIICRIKGTFWMNINNLQAIAWGFHDFCKCRSYFHKLKQLTFLQKNFYFFCRNHLNSDAFSVETDTGNVTSLVQQFNIAAPFAHYIYVQTLHKYTCLCSVSVWPHQNLVRFPNPNQLYPTHAKLQKNHEKIIIYSYFVSIEVIFIHFVSSWKQLSHFKFSDEEFLSFPPFCFFNRFSRLWFVNLSIFP